MTTITRTVRLLMVVTAGWVARETHAKTEDPQQGVWIDVRARLDPGGTSCNLDGYFMSPDPTMPTSNEYFSYDYGWSSRTGWVPIYTAPHNNYYNGASIDGSQYPVGAAVAVGKTNQLVVSPGLPDTSPGDVCVSTPPGYRVIMNGNETKQARFYGSWLYWIQVLPASGASIDGKVGEFLTSASITMAMNWQLSLGYLHNGQPAGSISLADSGARADWSPLFTPAMLSFETSSDEIAVYRENDVVRQVIANQVAVDVVTLSSTSYELRCYNPDQITNTDYPRTFSGSPFVVYRVEQGTTPTSIKFTREYRNITDLTSTFPIARQEWMSVNRESTGSAWQQFRWTRTSWTRAGDTPVAQTSTESTVDTNGIRTESIAISNDGTTNAAAFRLTRSYAPSGGNERVAGETVGTHNPLPTTFTYFNDTSNTGSFGYLQSVVQPGAKWIAYDYLNPDSTISAITGLLHYEYRPFGNSPSVPTLDPSQGVVCHYEYTANEYGAPIWPALIERQINGVLVAKTTFNYAFDQAYPNGHSVTRTTRTDFKDSTGTVVTQTAKYRQDWGQSLFRGQPYSETTPDGVRTCYAYERGTWDGAAFTAGDGPATRITAIVGSTKPASGTLIQQWNTCAIDDVYLVDGKSTAESTTRNAQGLIIKTESLRWKSGQWNLTQWTNCAYDLAGELVSKVSNNGSTYTAQYDGGLKISDTDEQGVARTYTYDSAGRLLKTTRVGAGPIATVITRNVYDAADHVVQQIVGDDQPEQLVTAHQFDDAGRLASETPAGLGTTTHSYDVSARSHTTTRPDGATTIETVNLDGTPSSKTGSAVIAEYYSYGVDPTTGQRWNQTNVGASNSARWTRHTYDWLDRELRFEHPGFANGANFVADSYYDSSASPGRIWKKTNTGTAATLYEYDALGQLSRSGLDVNGNDQLDLSSNDRITDTNIQVEMYNGQWWLRSDTISYPYPNSATPVTLSAVRTRLTGFADGRLSEVQTTDAESVTTSETIDVDRASQTSLRTQTRTGLSGAKTIHSQSGFRIAETTYDGRASTTTYDSLLRTHAVTDARGNSTTTQYVAGSQLISTVRDASGAVTTYHYDANGRKDWQKDPSGYYTRFEYNLRDQIIRQWGDGIVPVAYGFDDTFGDRISMSTFRSGTGWDGTDWPTTTGPADTTTWTFDQPSGLLAAKTDALGRTLSQTYCSCGKIESRANARGTVTYYGYDQATGEITNIGYSDATPTITYSYTRLGQIKSISDATGVNTFTFAPSTPWRLGAETFSDFFGGRVFTYLYEETGMPGRIRGYQVGNATVSNSDLEVNYAYSADGRLDSVTSGTNANYATRTFRYAYLPNSELVQSLTVDNSAFSVARTYDHDRDLVVSNTTRWNTTIISQFTFTHDQRRNRSSVVQSGTAYDDYGDDTHRTFSYDSRGQLTADIGFVGSDAADQSRPLPSRRFEYQYDAAGNRIWSNHTGVDMARENYTSNALNQVVTKENNSQSSTGATATTDNVTVDSAPAGRQGRFYSGEVLPPTTSSPSNYSFLVAITTSGGATSTETRVLLALSSQQSFTYDADGNLTSDGVWDYTWDAENRLVRMVTTMTASQNGIANREVTFKYDHLGRRVEKRVVNLTTSGEVSARRFLYDGWNMIAEFDAPNGSTGPIVRSYTWGLDVVDSLTSSGGVGALLQIIDSATRKAYLPTYDANGNVATLVGAETGAIAASYEYSPYGEPLRATAHDLTIADQPFRYSTKFADLETGLVYYGRRYYDPRLGRWLSRDPKEELGGVNLYGFVGNNAINRWDYLGMCGEETPDDATEYGGDPGSDPTIDSASSSNPTDLRVSINGTQTGSATYGQVDDLIVNARAAGIQVSTGGGSSTPDQTQNGSPTNPAQSASYNNEGAGATLQTIGKRGGAELTGNAERDIAFAYVWLNRFYADDMKSVTLDRYTLGSLSDGITGHTNYKGYGDIIIDYSQNPNMAYLVGTMWHEAQHASGGISSGFVDQHTAIINQMALVVQAYQKWQSDLDTKCGDK